MAHESKSGKNFVEMEFDADNPGGDVLAPDGTVKSRREIYSEASEGTEILDDYNASHLLDEFEAFDLMYDVSKTEAAELRLVPYVILYGGFHEAQKEKLRRDIANLPAEKFDAVFDVSSMTLAETQELLLALRQAEFPATVLDKIELLLKGDF